MGAVTGEAGISGRQVGAIDIADRFSLVEVSEERVDEVIASLQGRKIKGKKIRLRHDREG